MSDIITAMLACIGVLIWVYGTLAVFYLKKIASFNRDLHAVLLEKNIQKDRQSLHVRLQAPIVVWRESAAKAPDKPAQMVEKPAQKPEKKPKIDPKTIAECQTEHVWAKDKEDKYYCKKCGKRF